MACRTSCLSCSTRNWESQCSVEENGKHRSHDRLYVWCIVVTWSTVSFNFVFVAVSLPKLQQIAKIKAQQVPTLSVLAPYLELSTKQDYLVSRTQGVDLTAKALINCCQLHNNLLLKEFSSIQNSQRVLTWVHFTGILVARGEGSNGIKVYLATHK